MPHMWPGPPNPNHHSRSLERGQSVVASRVQRAFRRWRWWCPYSSDSSTWPDHRAASTWTPSGGYRTVTKPWWVRIPGRIEFELDALRDACSEVAILMQDDESGRLSVAFAFELDGTRYGLRAEFPAAYPYTRPMVYGDQRYFKWHQNPFGKNLSLLGRNA